jgi:dolichol-phosphate mannosyltransferase
LPALNEESGVAAVINRIPDRSMREVGIIPRVTLLDGNSTDGTRAVAQKLGAEVFVQSGKGKGAALREFLPKITEKYTVLLDCDGTYPPEIIPRFLEKLAEGKSVVVGSRILGSIEEGAMSGTNYLGNRILSALASFLFRTPITDVCSGMWAFDTEQLKSLGLTADGFDIEADIFARFAGKGVAITEIPIPYHRRIGEAKLRAWEGLRIAFVLMRERLLVASHRHVEASSDTLSPPAGQVPHGH